MTYTDAWGYKLLPLKSGREWMVLENYIYKRGSLAIVVPEGFVYDGASIPRIFWRLIGPPMAGKYAHAALLHDYLYVYRGYKVHHGRRVAITRQQADDFMLTVMVEDDVDWWRRNVMHKAVRTAGGRVWNKRSKTS